MAQSTANRVYQDFEPFFEWAEEEASATLFVMMPGYNKDQLRVEVTSTPTLRIKGERQISGNIWRRFMKEFPIPPYCDTNEITAKINHGILNVKFSKLIAPAKPQEEATNPPEGEVPMPPQQPPRRADWPDPPAQEVDQQKLPQNKEKEPISDEKEKNKIEEAAAAAANERQAMTHQDVNQGSGCLITGGLKRPKILMNMIVAILLVVVFGMYLKNVLRSSQGGSKFQEF